MVFMGTLVTGGEGLGVVVATGSYTEIGLIQLLVGETATPRTPLERQLEEVGDRLVLLCCGLCGLVFLIGLWQGFSFLEMLREAVCLAAAAVPEGLPAAATTTLALGVRNMRRHKVLVRHLPAVETLGSVQKLCLDKTGTITLNRMTVVRVLLAREVLEVKDNQFLGPAGPVTLEQYPDCSGCCKWQACAMKRSSIRTTAAGNCGARLQRPLWSNWPSRPGWRCRNCDSATRCCGSTTVPKPGNIWGLCIGNAGAGIS